MTGLGAAGCAALAVLLAVGQLPRRLLSLRGSRSSGRSGRIGRHVLVAVLVVVAPVVLGGQPTVVLLAVVAVAATVRWLRRRARCRADAEARRGRVIEACAVLAADLRAGRIPRDALAAAAEVCPDLAPAVSTVRLGGDVGAALGRAAGLPGAAGLRALGASWRVAEESGAAFAGVCERVADALRADEQVRRQAAAGLAGARSTARLLASLPVLGLGLGHAVGAKPLEFLTGTPVGWCCLALGLALAVAGLAWVERLADSCEEPTR